jgi:hypothetical protein
MSIVPSTHRKYLPDCMASVIFTVTGLGTSNLAITTHNAVAELQERKGTASILRGADDMQLTTDHPRRTKIGRAIGRGVALKN